MEANSVGANSPWVESGSHPFTDPKNPEKSPPENVFFSF